MVVRVDYSYVRNSIKCKSDLSSSAELLQHPAHLAVFLNYVISNSDPNPLLFFLITGKTKKNSKYYYFQKIFCRRLQVRLSQGDEKVGV